MSRIGDRDDASWNERLAAADRADGRDSRAQQMELWRPGGYEVPEPEGDEDPDRLWHERPIFEHIHQFARSRRVAPWAVLAGVLARVVAATPPTVQLPPTIGSNASLNLFVGLVGPSGSGKDASRGVARDALTIDTNRGARSFMEAPLGSGEGLSHMFMRRERVSKDNPDPPLVQYNTAALVSVSEIDTLGAIAARQASTLMAQLRQAAMGEQLGFFYVDTAKRMIVPEHAYRLCLMAGIQPLRAEGLLSDADGGTPQRFVWIPVIDREMPDERPTTPTPALWRPPQWGFGADHVTEMKVCDEACEVIDRAHLARGRGEGDALDGHALLTRLKVAAALAILDGRPEVEDPDWELARIVMEVSDMTRASVRRALDGQVKQLNEASAHAEAHRQSIISDRGDRDARIRVAQVLKRALARLAEGEEMTRGRLLNRVAGRDRDYGESALAALVDTGEVVESVGEHHGQPVERYRLASRG